MEALVFSILVATAFAFIVVGVLCFFVGGWAFLSRAGVPGWHILVPFWGEFQLFKLAHTVVLFLVEVLCAGAMFVLWMVPWPEVGQFWAIPLCIALALYGWSTMALAQCLHLSAGWQLLAFVAPPYFYALAAADKAAAYDPTAVPWAAAPFWRVECALYEPDEVPDDPRVLGPDEIDPYEVSRSLDREDPMGGYEISPEAAEAYGMENLFDEGRPELMTKARADAPAQPQPRNLVAKKVAAKG